MLLIGVWKDQLRGMEMCKEELERYVFDNPPEEEEDELNFNNKDNK